MIRKATKTDADVLSKLMILAMKDIVFQFIGEQDLEKGHTFLNKFISEENNQYSYQNIYVASENEKIIGQICVYSGEQLFSLPQPILEYIADTYGTPYSAAEETRAGEIYIDSIAVEPSAQGKGVGKKLLQHIISEYVNQQRKTIGLLVETNNPNAKKLYENMGFTVKESIIIFEKEMEHMQHSPSERRKIE